MSRARFLFLGSILCLATTPIHAQTNNLTNATATPSEGVGHDYIKLLSETVDPSNGTLSVRIGVPVPPGRGLTLPFSFAYDSNGVWVADHSVSAAIWNHFPGYGYLYSDGWSYLLPRATTNSATRIVRVCTTGNNCRNVPCTYFNNWTYGDANGGRHNLGLLTQNLSTQQQSSCHFQFLNQVLIFPGPTLTASVASASENVTSLRVAEVDGTTSSFVGTTNGLATQVEDRNGNIINIHDAGGEQSQKRTRSVELCFRLPALARLGTQSLPQQHQTPTR